MQTFLSETFFAGINITNDIELEGIQLSAYIFHCKRRLAIIGSVDNVGNYYFAMWQGALDEGFEVEDFVQHNMRGFTSTIICANM